MAIEVTKRRVCDVCKEADARTYKIGFPAPVQTRTLDLCDEHAAPLEALRKIARARHSTAPPRTVTSVAAVTRSRVKKNPTSK